MLNFDTLKYYFYLACDEKTEQENYHFLNTSQIKPCNFFLWQIPCLEARGFRAACIEAVEAGTLRSREIGEK